MKTTKLFSRPLFGQDIRSFWFFVLAVVLVMSMMSCVVTIAIDAIQTDLAGSADTAMVERMAKMGIQVPQMDPSVILDTMYYKVIVLIPIFLLVVAASNALIAAQVDDGSMAYILSTPTERGAVAFTHMVFMLLVPLVVTGIVCGVKCVLNEQIAGDADVAATVVKFAGMYVLVEAVAAICYLGSCLFNHNSRALTFGGGITVWCFIASLLGVFGSEKLVEMGVGIEQLDIFNQLTLVGLLDITAMETVGSDAVNYDFVWKLGVLAGVAVVAYGVGALRFRKKDLPL